MIDTEIEGDPAAVTGAATWLRDTLQANVAEAADLEADARIAAHSQWEGEAAQGYRSLVATVVTATDEHATRIGRAATACDDYAAHLTGVQRTMSGLRARASGGGLSVVGYAIQPPPAVPPGVVEQGSLPEAARNAAIDRIALYDTLSGEATTTRSRHTQWIESRLPGDVDDAKEKDLLDSLLGGLKAEIPNFLGGAGAGLSSLAIMKLSSSYADQAREYARRSRVSGDPWVRGSADTPAGRANLDDLLGKGRRLGRLGRILGGPVGIGTEVAFGIKDGVETGDWARAGLTAGASIAAGAAVVGAIALAPVAVPAVAVVLAAGGAAALASWGVGAVYDNWDEITGWGGDRVADVKDFAGDVGDTVGGVWDSVTPW